MEAIPPSLRDLAQMAPRNVGRSRKIDIFLRLPSSRGAILPQTSKVRLMSPDPRWRLHSEATFECGNEVEEASIVSGEFVVSGCDASEVFDLVEEAFDQVTVFVDRGIEAAPFGGDGPAWDNRLCAAGCDGIHGPLPIVSLVCQNVACLEPVEQPLDLGYVIAFAAGQDEADRVAQGIGGGMDLGAQPAFGASQRVSFKPIFGSIAFFGTPALC